MDVPLRKGPAASYRKARGKPVHSFTLILNKLNKLISCELLEIEQPQHLSSKSVYRDYWKWKTSRATCLYRHEHELHHHKSIQDLYMISDTDLLLPVFPSLLPYTMKMKQNVHMLRLFVPPWTWGRCTAAPWTWCVKTHRDTACSANVQCFGCCKVSGSENKRQPTGSSEPISVQINLSEESKGEGQVH